MRSLPAVCAPGPIADAPGGQEAGGVHLEGGCRHFSVDGYRIRWDADDGTGGSLACAVEAFFRGREPHAAAARVEGMVGCNGKAADLYAGQVAVESAADEDPGLLRTASSRLWRCRRCASLLPLFSAPRQQGACLRTAA